MAEGHRQRMRKRIEANGLEGLEDHEILEYLLYFVQPRIDTNKAAHQLISAYSSLNGVFDASRDDLEQVEGIGPSSAQFLALVPELCRRYYLGCRNEKERFVSVGRVVEFLYRFYLGVKEETAVYMLLNADKSLISANAMAKGSFSSVYVNNRDIVAEALNRKAAFVIFSHNHPGNDAVASESDVILTNHLVVALKSVDIILADHVIMCPDGSYYSFSKERCL